MHVQFGAVRACRNPHCWEYLIAPEVLTACCELDQTGESFSANFMLSKGHGSQLATIVERVTPCGKVKNFTFLDLFPISSVPTSYTLFINHKKINNNNNIVIQC